MDYVALMCPDLLSNFIRIGIIRQKMHNWVQAIFNSNQNIPYGCNMPEQEEGHKRVNSARCLILQIQ